MEVDPLAGADGEDLVGEEVEFYEGEWGMGLRVEQSMSNWWGCWQSHDSWVQSVWHLVSQKWLSRRVVKGGEYLRLGRRACRRGCGS